jgi:hypothetical protein
MEAAPWSGRIIHFERFEQSQEAKHEGLLLAFFEQIDERIHSKLRFEHIEQDMDTANMAVSRFRFEERTEHRPVVIVFWRAR